MGPSLELYGALLGIGTCTAASAAWWRWQLTKRSFDEHQKLEQSLPTSRDGLLLAALVVEIWDDNGPVSSREEWLGDLWVLLDAIVSRHMLKKVGTYQNTYMIASTDQRIAEEALMLTASTSLGIRDAIHMFIASKDLKVHARFGVHADIIPTVGLGSTIALSQLWNEAMEIAERARPNAIELSPAAAEWLGPQFNIEQLDERPILQARRSA